jgi:hypothetical protein
LKQKHKDDPAIASAVVRDEVYLHAAPGRETERFYRLAEGEKLKLLMRATKEQRRSHRRRMYRFHRQWKTGGWCATRRGIQAGY